MTSTPLPTSHCLNCGRKATRASNLVGEQTPRPGDITICIGCGHIMAFADDLTLRALTDAEMVEIAGDRRIVAYQQALAEVRKADDE